MAEPDKRQFGDGSDNYSQAASDLVRAANEARNQAASAAAGASVSGGIKVGKAVAGIAKGAAAGGSWAQLHPPPGACVIPYINCWYVPLCFFSLSL